METRVSRRRSSMPCRFRVGVTESGSALQQFLASLVVYPLTYGSDGKPSVWAFSIQFGSERSQGQAATLRRNDTRSPISPNPSKTRLLVGGSPASAVKLIDSIPEG